MMSRFLMMCALAMGVLFGCGKVITISLPGGPPTLAFFHREGALPHGYARFLSPASYNFRYSAPTEPVRRGDVSERYELRDGDCVDADCTAGRLRAEISETDTSTTARVGQDIWYGWSFYNDNMGAVPREKSIGLVLGQWKPAGDQPPAFRIVQTATGEMNWAKCDPKICSNSGTDADDVVAELENVKVAANWGPAQNNGDVCRLFSMEGMRGKWVDIVVNTNFGAGEDGYLRIWINGALKCNYTGRMVWGSAAEVDGAPLTHRRGLFASYTKPWRTQQGGAAIPTMVAYYDEFLSGKLRGDVDPALRETAGLRPKD
jgi:hypothetical protein